MPPQTLTPATSRGTPGSDTLARLVEQVRSLLAVDAVTFFEIDEQAGTVGRPVGWFADPVLSDALGGPWRSPLSERGSELLGAVLTGSRPLLLSRLDAWDEAPQLLEEAVSSLGPGRVRTLWRRYRSASVIACPLRTETGGTEGLLVVATLSGRSLTGGDVRALEALVDLAAMTLAESARLAAAERRAEDEQLLARAAEAMGASLELEVVLQRATEHAAGLTGASGAAIGPDLREGAGAAWPGPERRRALREGPGVARTGAIPSGEGPGVAQTGANPSPSPPSSRFQRRATPPDGGSRMHAAIEVGPRPYGVLSVWHDEPQRFSEADLERLNRHARSAEFAIANAIDFERERRIARTLTLGFVPEPLPELPGYATGLVYAPAFSDPIGGDVYGAWPIPGGRMALLVGDVARKGVEAAALSSMVRFFIEARSWHAPGPAVVLEQTNAMLAGRLPDDAFITAFLAFIGPGSLRYANAGHFPPLHVAGTETTELREHGLPLGVSDDPTYAEAELGLAAGDLVFGYTDGLVDARRGGELFGAERLTRLVEGWARTLGPQDLARTVHEDVSAWAGGLTDDAVALAVLRR